LDKPSDWESWDLQFRQVTDRVWEEVLGNKPWKQTPTNPPSVTKYKIAGLAGLSADIPQELAVLVAAEAAGTLTFAQREQGIETLTNDQATQYSAAAGRFREEVADCDKQAEHCREIKMWVVQTVSENYHIGSCPPYATLTTWYTNLRASTAQGALESHSKLFNEYHALMLTRPKGKATPDDRAWLRNWEGIMGKVTARKVPGLTNPRFWLHDLILATGAAYPVWATGFEHKGRIKTRLQDESLDFHTVARELSSAMDIVASQEALEMQSSGHARGNTNAAHKGSDPVPKSSALAATFAEGKSRKRKRDNKTNRVTKRRRSNNGVNPKSCDTCSKPGHTADNCWYGHPDKAPSNFHPNTETREKVEEKIDSKEGKEGNQPGPSKKVRFSD